VGVWIGGVGLSRVYLGVHTPLDVAAGFAVGVGVVCFWRILPTSLKKLLHLK
jgi:membrane-associated phospholipid phosphatase